VNSHHLKEHAVLQDEQVHTKHRNRKNNVLHNSKLAKTNTHYENKLGQALLILTVCSLICLVFLTATFGNKTGSPADNIINGLFDTYKMGFGAFLCLWARRYEIKSN